MTDLNQKSKASKIFPFRYHHFFSKINKVTKIFEPYIFLTILFLPIFYLPHPSFASEIFGFEPDPENFAFSMDSPEQMIIKMKCPACHRIPTIESAKHGVVGPLLVLGTTAQKRISSSQYQTLGKNKKLHAKTPKEYVIESIFDPSAFIVPGFPAPNGKSLMPPNYAEKFTYSAAVKLADFLISLYEEDAIVEGLDRSPYEIEGSFYK